METIVVATMIAVAHHFIDSIFNSSSNEEDNVVDNRHVVIACIVLPENHPKPDICESFFIFTATFGGIFVLPDQHLTSS